MNLSTAEKQKYFHGVTKLSTKEALKREYGGILSPYELALMKAHLTWEERNQKELECIAEEVRSICVEKFPWLQCESVEFCKQQRREELVLINVRDARDQLPRQETAIAIENAVLNTRVSPWLVVVESE